jgi:hypothetical protein
MYISFQVPYSIFVGKPEAKRPRRRWEIILNCTGTGTGTGTIVPVLFF